MNRRSLLLLTCSLLPTSCLAFMPNLADCSIFMNVNVKNIASPVSYFTNQIQKIDACAAACGDLYPTTNNPQILTQISTCSSTLNTLSFTGHYHINLSKQLNTSSPGGIGGLIPPNSFESSANPNSNNTALPQAPAPTPPTTTTPTQPTSNGIRWF